MKKLLSLIMAAAIIIAVSAFVKTSRGEVADDTATTTEPTTVGFTTASEKSEIRAVWISFSELSMKSSQDKSEKAFTAKVSAMLSDIAKAGYNTVFVHVRPNSDAFYDSGIFPPTEYLSGKQGVSPGYDALKIICSLAKEPKLSVHAWINPFRISTGTDPKALAQANPATGILNDDSSSNDTWICTTDSGMYYNPAVEELQALIIDGAREIVQNYNVAGIHIDDYFYPTTSENFDKAQYSEYRSGGGKLELADWRRANIDAFVSGMYRAVKAVDSNLIFSISPAGDISLNRNQYYADVESWCSHEGYCDIIIPQLYYGFSHESHPFEDVCRKWCGIATCPEVKVLYGLAPYKCGTEDKFAGTGSSEWLDNSDILSRQLSFVRQQSRYDGFAMFSSSYLFGDDLTENGKNEIKLFDGMLK